MYTRKSNKSADGKTALSVTLSCNVAGCKEHFDGKTNAEVWLRAREAGWLLGKANNEICKTHRGGYHMVSGIATVRTPKDEKVAKSNGKAEKVAKATKKADKPAKGTTKAQRKVAFHKGETSANLGQSIGKLARTAKNAKKA